MVSAVFQITGVRPFGRIAVAHAIERNLGKHEKAQSVGQVIESGVALVVHANHVAAQFFNQAQIRLEHASLVDTPGIPHILRGDRTRLTETGSTIQAELCAAHLEAAHAKTSSHRVGHAITLLQRHQQRVHSRARR